MSDGKRLKGRIKSGRCWGSGRGTTIMGNGEEGAEQNGTGRDGVGLVMGYCRRKRLGAVSGRDSDNTRRG